MSINSITFINHITIRFPLIVHRTPIASLRHVDCILRHVLKSGWVHAIKGHIQKYFKQVTSLND